MKNFIVEVEFEGWSAPPLRIPVQRRIPDDALRMVKNALLDQGREGSIPAGVSVFTIAVYPESYPAGAEALTAERIRMVTMPFADEIECDEA